LTNEFLNGGIDEGPGPFKLLAISKSGILLLRRDQGDMAVL